MFFDISAVFSSSKAKSCFSVKLILGKIFDTFSGYHIFFLINRIFFV